MVRTLLGNLSLLLTCFGGCAEEHTPIQLGGAVDSQLEPLAIAPYLLDVGTDSATLCWRTATRKTSGLSWLSATDAQATTADTPVGYQHRVRIDGLLAGTVHHYQVERHRGSFRTMKEKDALFVAIGHTHGTEGFDHYLDTLLAAAVVEQTADFVVHVGDTTWRALVPDYRRFLFRPLYPVFSSTPVFIAPGNHDAGWPFPDGVDLSAFKELFPHPYPDAIATDRRNAFYGVTKAGVRLTFLSYVADSRPGSPQMLFLARELALPARLHIVVFGGAQTGYYNEQKLLGLLREGGCSLVLRGDGEQPADVRTWEGDMPMYYLGSGGASPHALLRFEWSDPTLRVERILPTFENELVDELALVEGKLVRRAGATRIMRDPLPPTSGPPRLAPGENPTALAIVAQPGPASDEDELVTLGRALGVDGVVAQSRAGSAFDPCVAVIDQGDGWRVGELGRVLVWAIHDLERAGTGPRLSAAAHREYDGFRIAVVSSSLAAEGKHEDLLGEEFDLVLSPSARPRDGGRRLGRARWIRFSDRLPQQLVVEAQTTHLTVKSVGMDRSCNLLGWAYRTVPGIERHAIDPSKLDWKPHGDSVMARLPMDGARPRGLGCRLRLKGNTTHIGLNARCKPRGLPPPQPGHTQGFEGFRTDYFWIVGDDGELLMPLTTSLDGQAVGEVREVTLAIHRPATEEDVQFVELFWY